MNYNAAFELRTQNFSEEDIQTMLALRQTVNTYICGEGEYNEVLHEVDALRQEPWFPFAYLDGDLLRNPKETKWFQEFRFDPVPIIHQLHIPVLLLYGERDPWIPIPESIAIWKKHGIQTLTIHQIPDANHFMVSIAQAGLQSDSGPTSQEYLDIMLRWLKMLFVKD